MGAAAIGMLVLVILLARIDWDPSERCRGEIIQSVEAPNHQHRAYVESISCRPSGVEEIRVLLPEATPLLVGQVIHEVLVAPAGSRGFELSWDGNRRLLVTYPASITLLRGGTGQLGHDFYVDIRKRE